jgi:hypothetical protein
MGSVEYVIANKDPIHFNFIPNGQDSTQRIVRHLDHPNNHQNFAYNA